MRRAEVKETGITRDVLGVFFQNVEFSIHREFQVLEVTDQISHGAPSRVKNDDDPLGADFHLDLPLLL